MLNISDFEIPKSAWKFERDGRAVVHGQRVFVRIAGSRKKGNAGELRNLLSEIKILPRIGGHPHIVDFIGAYTRDISKGIVYLATEFCEKGSLRRYLSENKSWLLENELRTLGELARFSSEIASALEFLEKRRVSHVSEGAKSVLLTCHGICKLQGFRSSRRRKITNRSSVIKFEEYLLGYQVKEDSSNSHWRYTAPEARCGSACSKSDVWAFGVTVWEIYSLGSIPFDDVKYNDFEYRNNKLGQHAHLNDLPQPALASTEIYGMLQTCWNADPRGRPSFTELYAFFVDLRAGKYYLKL